MQRRTLRRSAFGSGRLWLALSAAVWVGCASDSGTGPGGPNGTATPADLAPALGAMCDLSDRCPDDLPRIASTSRGECVDILYWLLTCRLVEENDELVGTERVSPAITEAQAQACANFLDGLSCEDFDCVQDGSCPEAEACLGLFSGFGDGDDDGAEPAGSDCYSNSDCAAGLGCSAPAFDAAAAAPVCRVCVPALAEGDSCETTNAELNVRCEPGLVCIRTPEASTAGTCESPRLDGEDCYDDKDCASGFCSGGTCSSAGHEGDPCTDGFECRWLEQLTCIEGECEPYRANGEPCSATFHCRSVFCDDDGMCGSPIGGQCFDTADCRSGYCGSRRCSDPVANGEDCTTAEPEGCQSGFCDPDTSTCAPRPPPQPRGFACNADEECEDGFDCSGNDDVVGVCYMPCGEACPEGMFCDYTNRSECVPLREDGAGCDDDEECLSDFCNDAERCAQRPGLGDPCTGFSDCYPWGRCVDGACVEREGPGEACTSYDSCLEPYLCLEGRCTLISLSCEPAAIGQQCTYLRFCQENAYCDPFTFRCAARHGQGEECVPRLQDCLPALYCALDLETGYSCQPVLPAGSACTEEAQCVEGSFCIGGVCLEGEGGESCDFYEDCSGDTFCNDRTDRCEPYRNVGDECDDYDVLCDPDLYCTRDSPSTCAERPARGETCDRDTGCQPNAICDLRDGSSGQCIRRVAEGDPCQERFDDPQGSDCRPGLSCEYVEGEYICVPHRALGESCSRGSECESGICDSTFYRCASTQECIPPDG